jgi:2-polyprenyl-3-methyl-5-hydroxy-6-metoxy-1,4-benzoquinol methylase
MSAKSHWEQVYTTKTPTQVSWYQVHAQTSLELIQRTGISRTSSIIDVGGGTSTLVDDLIDSGFQAITVLDISRSALQFAQQRLGVRGTRVTWIEADITQVDLPPEAYEVWHDRAVFHFLTQPDDRQRYINAVRHSVRPGGHVIVATFALEGPKQCSGLDVMRYSSDGLHGEFGEDFELLTSVPETHHTPFGTEQAFIYCYCRRH